MNSRSDEHVSKPSSIQPRKWSSSRRCSLYRCVANCRLFVHVSRVFLLDYEVLRVGNARLPIALSDSGDDTVEKLLDRACPSSAPSYSACLALALVRAQLIDTDTLGEPKSSWERDILVQTLVEQDLSCEAMRNRAAQPPEAYCGVRQVVEPPLAGRVSQCQPWRRLEGVGRLQAAVLLPLLQHGNEQRGQRRDARLVLEVGPQRWPGSVRLIHDLRLVAHPCLDQRLGEDILSIAASPREDVRSLLSWEVHGDRHSLGGTQLWRVLHTCPSRQYLALLGGISQVHRTGPWRYGEIRGRLIGEGVDGQVEGAASERAVEDVRPASRRRPDLAGGVVGGRSLVLERGIDAVGRESVGRLRGPTHLVPRRRTTAMSPQGRTRSHRTQRGIIFVSGACGGKGARGRGRGWE